MDKYEKRVLDRLHDAGAELVSTRRHRKWRLSTGGIFVQPSTPSDWRNFRKQNSTLNRLLNSGNVEERIQEPPIDLCANAENHPSQFRPANSPARDKANVVIPKLSPSAQRNEKTWYQFKDINGLLSAVDEVPAFWELDGCGRVRVIMKLAEPFAEKLEVLTAFAVIAPEDEQNFAYLSPYIADHSEEAKQKRDLAMIMRYYTEWGGSAGPNEHWCRNMIGMPCLRITDPVTGSIVIEPSASGLLLGTEQLMAFGGLTFGYGCAKTSLPQWSDYEQAKLKQPTAHPYPYPDKGHLVYMFVDRDGMKRHNITYKVCGSWINPSVARKTIQSVHEHCRASDQYSVTLVDV